MHGPIVRHLFAAGRCAVAVFALLFASARADAATSVETLVLAVGGFAVGPGCSTGGVPAPISSFFGVWGVGLPNPGTVACGLAGNVDSQTSPTAPLTDELPVSTTFSGRELTATNHADARYGKLHADARSVYLGDCCGAVLGSEGMAKMSDEFVFASPSVSNGTAGKVVFKVTLAGALSTDGTGTVGVNLHYLAAATSPLLFYSQTSYSVVTPNLYSLTGVGLGGFAASPGMMSGSGEIPTAKIPIVFGTALPFDLGMLVYTQPGLTSTTDGDFDLQITGIEVLGPGDVPVTDFTVTAASGAGYDAGGLIQAAVPSLSPVALALLAVSLTAMATASVRRRQNEIRLA